MIETKNSDSTVKTAVAGLRAENVIFSKNKKQIKAIYHAAFPKKERMPFALMIAMSCLFTTKFLAYYDGDTLCGMIYMDRIVDQAFIMFFAVDENLRSKGYGSRILSTVRARYPRTEVR